MGPVLQRPSGWPYAQLSFPLRSTLITQVRLPVDLTKSEADRLCAAIQTYVMPQGA